MWVAWWVRKAENKVKAQHSTDIIHSKLIDELQHSPRLGKTFPGGWLVGWGTAGKKPNLSQLGPEQSVRRDDHFLKT